MTVDQRPGGGGARIALVTGAGSGLGAAISARLRADGLRVVTLDIEPAEGIDVVADVADPAGMSGVQAAVGPVDVLVNSAGVIGPDKPLVDVEDEEWARTIEVNLSGTFHACRAFVPDMVAAGWGRVVNIASMAGKDGTAGLTVYSASKAGVIGLTTALGKELATSGVLVNAVAPAVPASPGAAPVARCEAAAELVAWLASDRCSFSTGAVYEVSSGA